MKDARVSRGAEPFAEGLQRSGAAIDDGVVHSLVGNAFWALGGVPKIVVFDNAKAVVSQADWYDPELNPKIVECCRHYGFTLLPTRPRTPRHKGKVERGVGYVQSNALRGRSFDSLARQNEHLWHWERTVADTRIHGTTKQHVRQLFETVERTALGPLANRFPSVRIELDSMAEKLAPAQEEAASST